MTWPSVPFEDLYREPSRNGVYKSSEHHGDGVRIVNMGELFAHDVIGNQVMKRIRMSVAEMSKSGLEDGDLLFGRRSLIEAGAGKCSLVEDLSEPTTFESSIIRVRLDRNRARPRFIYYWLKSPHGRGHIRSIVTGTNVKGIRGSVLKTLPVACPPSAVQDALVRILRTYDDLIENNTRRIKLLEDAARLLYEEWFVRLRFPGHEHTPIHGGVPEGWVPRTFGDLCDEIRECVSPESVAPNTPYFGLEHLPRRSVTLDSWGRADEVSSTKHRFLDGDILFGKIRPYFHKVGIAFVDGIVSSDAIVIRPREESLRSLLLMTASSDSFVAVTSKTMREGSKMPRADWSQMQAYSTPLPPVGLLESFNSVIQPILAQLRCLSLASRQASLARDILLPRLMTGKVAV